MRRIVSGFVVAAGVSFTATGVGFAADLPVRMPVKAASVIPVVYNWTGCYIGAHAGYGWGHARNTDNPSSDFILGQDVVVDSTGVLGGGQVGCDYQLQSNFVIGISADVSAADISGSTLVTSPGISVTGHAKTEWLGTLTGRLGYSVDKSLLYVKGGLAWSHNKYWGDWTFPVPGGPTFAGTASGSDTPIGWDVGAGFEYAFAKNLSAFVEYNYMDFGTHTVTFPVPGFGTYIGDIRQTIQTAKVGLNYRFGGM